MVSLRPIDPYPYDKLLPLRALAERHSGGAIDLSVGTPCDAPPAAVVRALGEAQSLRGYPPSIGTVALRSAATEWLSSYLGVAVEPSGVAACVGTKEFVASAPGLLRVLMPARDTVLYPAVSYPTYAMGATLAGCRAVPVALDSATGRLELDSISAADRERALCLWVNSPSNPTGRLDDLAAAARWGREHSVPVFSDECYVAFTWASEPRSILQAGLDGVVALHSLSKRSNLAGLRVGFFAGDPALVEPLRELRKHAGLMVPGPAQHAAAVALSDETHVDEQRLRYQHRLTTLASLLAPIGFDAALPDGGFYLWCEAPQGDAWAAVTRLADDFGVLASPGEFYGPTSSGYVRFAVVAPDEAFSVLARRVDPS